MPLPIRILIPFDFDPALCLLYQFFSCNQKVHTKHMLSMPLYFLCAVFVVVVVVPIAGVNIGILGLVSILERSPQSPPTIYLRLLKIF